MADITQQQFYLFIEALNRLTRAIEKASISAVKAEEAQEKIAKAQAKEEKGKEPRAIDRILTKTADTAKGAVATDMIAMAADITKRTVSQPATDIYTGTISQPLDRTRAWIKESGEAGILRSREEIKEYHDRQSKIGGMQVLGLQSLYGVQARDIGQFLGSAKDYLLDTGAQAKNLVNKQLDILKNNILQRD